MKIGDIVRTTDDEIGVIQDIDRKETDTDLSYKVCGLWFYIKDLTPLSARALVDIIEELTDKLNDLESKFSKVEMLAENRGDMLDSIRNTLHGDC